jgi:hypothetical protein
VLRSQRRRGIDAELLTEQPPESVVHPQRLGVATGGCEHFHQQGAGTLAERLRLAERGQLDREALGGADRESDLGAALEGAATQLLEAECLVSTVGEVDELGVRRAVPPIEHGVEVGEVSSIRS